MWFKNLQIFRLPAPYKVDIEQLNTQLTTQAFSQCPSNEMQSEGWASPRDNGSLVHSVNQQILLLLSTEKKLLPSTVVNQVAKARAAELEEQQGFAPGRKAMKDLKERVTEELLPRAFGIKRSTWVWIDADLSIGTGSAQSDQAASDINGLDENVARCEYRHSSRGALGDRLVSRQHQIGSEPERAPLVSRRRRRNDWQTCIQRESEGA